jgi:multidrug efflux pump subunit AcrA (membrane-fusion protein)
VVSIQQQYSDNQRRYLPRKGLLALRRCHLWSRLPICGGMLFFAVGEQSQPSEFSVVNCVIRPSQIVDLGNLAHGVIQRNLVEQSDFVTVGQSVAQIDDGVERGTIERASMGTQIPADKQIERQVIRSTNLTSCAAQFSRCGGDRTHELFGEIQLGMMA